MVAFDAAGSRGILCFSVCDHFWRCAVFRCYEGQKWSARMLFLRCRAMLPIHCKTLGRQKVCPSIHRLSIIKCAVSLKRSKFGAGKEGGFGKGGAGNLVVAKIALFILLAWFFNEGLCKSSWQPAWDYKTTLTETPVIGQRLVCIASVLAILSRGFGPKWPDWQSTVGGMYARRTEIAKIAFFAFFAVLSWEVPKTAAKNRSENRRFRLFRRTRHTQIAKIAVRASWAVVALLVRTQCLWLSALQQ